MWARPAPSPAPTPQRRGDSDRHRMQTGPDQCETIAPTRCPSACVDGTLEKSHSVTQTSHFVYPSPTDRQQIGGSRLSKGPARNSAPRSTIEYETRYPCERQLRDGGGPKRCPHLAQDGSQALYQVAGLDLPGTGHQVLSRCQSRHQAAAEDQGAGEQRAPLSIPRRPYLDVEAAPAAQDR